MDDLEEDRGSELKDAFSGICFVVGVVVATIGTTAPYLSPYLSNGSPFLFLLDTSDMGL